MPFASLSDADIFYREGGAAAGGSSDLVFLHGLGLDHRVMTLLADAFARTHRTLVLDFRSHGCSGKAAIADLAELADDVEALLDRLDYRAPVLVGYSLGGAVAMEVAHRRNVTGVVLIATGVRAAPPPAIPSRSQRGQTRAAIQGAPDVKPRYEGLIGTPRAAADPAMLLQFAHALSHFEPPPPENLADIPALIIGAEIDDYYPPPVQKDLLSRFPRGRLVIVDDATHGVIVERPDVCEELVRDFLAAISETRGEHR